MILQALTQYYEDLASRGEISRSGWAPVKISYALELDTDGSLLQIIPLTQDITRKGKTVTAPREFNAPAPIKKTSGIGANFLWENAQYMLGLPKTDKEKDKTRAVECFNFMKTYHEGLLSSCESDMTRAILGFFQTWDTEKVGEHPRVKPILKELSGGANLTFRYNGRYAVDVPEFAGIWQLVYDNEEGDRSVCLVTGQSAIPQAVHPPIKGVRGAQSMGAAIVSFNAPAFTSYGKEQSFNAPIGKYAAFAYTTALNKLLSDGRGHRDLGGSTLVFWAENADPAGQGFMCDFMDSDSETVSQEELRSIVGKLASGRVVDINGLFVKPDNHFYILALSPNAARISVRFFYTDTFGRLAENLKKHYDRMEIVDGGATVPLWRILGATVRTVDGRAEGDPTPHLSGDLIQAILMGTRYPDTLFQQIMLRIRAERDITPVRAALIKAYLLNNEIQNHPEYSEVLTVKLNEETTYLPYVLGELFSLLEEIQVRASGVTTIKDRYYTSACTTPAIVFPRIVDLAEKHMKKLDTNARVYYSKELNGLMAMIGESYPSHLSLQDQGVFQIGYYHKTKKRFEKKNND